MTNLNNTLQSSIKNIPENKLLAPIIYNASILENIKKDGINNLSTHFLSHNQKRSFHSSVRLRSQIRKLNIRDYVRINYFNKKLALPKTNFLFIDKYCILKKEISFFVRLLDNRTLFYY
jgi:hypothetical protein